MNDLVPSRPTYFILIGYLKTGGMEGVRANPMNPNWIRHCLHMYAYAQTFWLHHTCACNSYLLQNIWAELSCEFGPSCLINLGRVGMGRVLSGPSWQGPSWFWAELPVIRHTCQSKLSFSICFVLISILIVCGVCVLKCF